MTQPTSPPTCNTTHPIYPILQYNFQPTTHPKAMSRYNFPLYRDIVLGSSPNQFYTFFFRFSHIFFSSLFCYWKHQKYLSFFFPHSLVHLNKFIKIYFHSFFFSFTPCKTLENHFLHHIFFFSNKPNKFIKIYFIIFFFQHLYVLITKHTNNHNTYNMVYTPSHIKHHNHTIT